MPVSQAQRLMEQTTTTEGVVQQEVLTGRQGATGTARATNVTAPAPFRVWFSTKEVVELTGLSRNTLKFWRKRRRVQPARKGGNGNEDWYSAWQTLAFAILAAANRGRGYGCYLGDISVKRAMESVANLDDALLLREDVQDPYMAEAAAKIASAALPQEELSPAGMVNLARVVAAIDRKATMVRKRIRLR